MPENDFLVWAASATTEIYTQSQYASLVQLGPGVAPGIADPLAYNKTLRQATAIASVIAQFIVAESGQPAIDDGTTATLLTNFDTAVQNFVYALALSTGVLNGTVGTPTFAPNPSFTGTATISVGGGLGGVTTGSGGSSYPGNMSFYNPAGTRVGYIGASNGANYLMLETENGYLGYSLTGNLIVGGNLTVGDNATVNGQLQIAGFTYFGNTGQFAAYQSGANQIFQLSSGNYIEWVSGTGIQVVSTGSITVAPQSGAGYMLFTGNEFTAINASLRASNGARGSGDGNRCVLLGDYVFSGPGNGYVILPNGIIIQWGQGLTPGTNDYTVYYPLAFPNALLVVVGCAVNSSAAYGAVAAFGSTTNFGAHMNEPTNIEWIAMGY